MASLLYRLGRSAADRAWTVVAAWLVVLGLAGGAFAVFGGTLTSTVTIPGTATQAVSDQLAERFPDLGGGSGSVVMTTEDDTPFTPEQQQEIAALLGDVTEVDGVSGATDPFVTQAQVDAQAEQLAAGQEQVEAGTAQLATAQSQLDAARQQAEAAGQPAAVLQQLDAQQAALDQSRTELETQGAALEQGAALLELSEGIRQVSTDETTAVSTVQFDETMFEVSTETKEAVLEEMTGADIAGVEIEVSTDIAATIPEVFGIGEAVGLAVAVVVLLVMLGTLIGAGLPLINALVGVGVGVAASLALSGTVEMLSVTPALGIMLGLAVGIDYSLFILNRHRKQLRDGVPLKESIGLANGTSGNAVVFAGATVMIALLALNLTGIPFLGLMGTVGAVCVFAAILIAITMTPALLSLVGERIISKRERARAPREVASPATVRPMSTRRAVITLVGGTVALLVVAIPALSMRLGLPAGSSEPLDSTAYQAYQLVDDKFGAGVNGPLIVVADLPEAVTDEELLAEQLRVGTEIGAQDDVVAVAPVGASEDGMLLAFQVVPEGGPTAESTEQLVRDLRGLELDGVESFGVAGNASGNIDVSESLSDALPLYLVVVVGLSLIILVFVFRSILVPLTATLGFVLSLFAAIGGVTAVFQWGWLAPVFGVHDPGPILSFLPILMVGILFGLAMDYQLFLVSGMREAYAHGSSSRVAVQRGVHAGRAVVVAAALIMVSVFGGFVFAHSVMIQSIGLGLALGVLLDAFVVRLLLIPAVMHLLGDAAWWLPGWLDKILPDVDVEGASLERSHGTPVTDAGAHVDPDAEVDEVTAVGGPDAGGKHAG